MCNVNGDIKSLIVCKDCLNAIVSRGEKVFHREIDLSEFIDRTDIEIIETSENGYYEWNVKCAWCDELIPVSDCVEVI